MGNGMQILLPILLGILGLVVGYFIRKKLAEGKLNQAEDLATKIIIDAEKSAEQRKTDLVYEAKEEIYKMRDKATQENNLRREELQKLEERLLTREDVLDKKNISLEQREGQLQVQSEEIKTKFEEAEELLQKRVLELERVAALSQEEAKKLLLSRLEDELVHETAIKIRENEQRIREESKKISQNIIVHTIQGLATDIVAENTVSVVNLPNDDMKGRIIGREGRNIRSIESHTGVDLIIDDTPEAVVLSSFDPVRREVARITLEKLIQDGRIHPSRIEETIEKAQREVDNAIKESGEEAAFEAGVHDLHPELVKYLGRLKYRTSYGQNVLKHAVEVSKIAGLLADELDLDSKVARRAGLLHDIGKSIDREVESPHVDVGVELARKYQESEEVINGIEAHHGDVEFSSLESIIVQVADAISAARPGARRESLENYIKRLETLENIANSFDGVEKSYAIQAGREVRIIVQPEKISESELTVMARNIVKEIESTLDFPGQIRVNLLRETRVIEYAK